MGAPFDAALDRRALTWLAAACALVVVVGLGVGVAERQWQTGWWHTVQQLAADPSRGSLLVRGDDGTWYQPLGVYPSALLLRAGASPHLALRLPEVASAVAAMALLYLFAVADARRPMLGAISACMLLAAPGFVRAVHDGGGALPMVPAVLGWLVAMVAVPGSRAYWIPALGGVSLAMAAYTQPAGVLAVPVYFVIGGFVSWRAHRDPLVLLAAAGGVTLALVPLAIWVLWHPEAYVDTFGRWAIHAAHVVNPWEGLLATTRWHVLARRVGTYWDYLNPVFLFGWNGMLGPAMLGLIGAGVWTMARTPATWGQRLMLAGFLAAAVPGVLLDVDRAATWALMLAPCGALLGAWGGAALAGMRGWAAWTAAGLALLLLLRGLTLPLEMMFNS